MVEKTELIGFKELNEQVSNELGRKVSEDELTKTLIKMGVLIDFRRTAIMSKQGFDNGYLVKEKDDTSPNGKFRGWYTKKLKDELVDILKEKREDRIDTECEMFKIYLKTKDLFNKKEGEKK